MTTQPIESVPQARDDARDSAFFQCVADLFSPEFLYGASVLLASYDPESAGAPQAAHPGPVAARHLVTHQPRV